MVQLVLPVTFVGLSGTTSPNWAPFLSSAATTSHSPFSASGSHSAAKLCSAMTLILVLAAKVPIRQ